MSIREELEQLERLPLRVRKGSMGSVSSEEHGVVEGVVN